MNKLPVFTDFIRFIRIEMCLCTGSIALSGYLLSGPPEGGWPFLFLAMFFGTASGYALNHMTDREEDRINNRGLNVFARRRSGWLVFLASGSAGFFFALFTGNVPFLLYALVFSLSSVYSLGRVKKIPLAKNVCTGAAISLVFLTGAAAGGQVNPRALAYMLFFGSAFFISNLAGDVRGFEGDVAAGIRTIPVIIGLERSMRLVQAGFASLAFVALFGFGFFSMVPLIALSLVFFLRGDLPRSRLAFLGSFLPVPLFIALGGA